jgi:type I restriction enzyme M protein
MNSTHPSNPSKNSTANLGFEAKLWLAADKLRNNMDAAEYKHAVLGLIYLEYIIDRVHRELTDADLENITSRYHAWRGGGLTPSRQDAKKGGKGEPLGAFAPLREYFDVPGVCKSATTAEIAAHGHVLTPGRYVGAEEIADDGDPFEEKLPRLVAELHARFSESAKLEAAIRANPKSLDFTE